MYLQKNVKSEVLRDISIKIKYQQYIMVVLEKHDQERQKNEAKMQLHVLIIIYKSYMFYYKNYFLPNCERKKEQN